MKDYFLKVNPQDFLLGKRTNVRPEEARAQALKVQQRIDADRIQRFATTNYVKFHEGRIADGCDVQGDIKRMREKADSRKVILQRPMSCSEISQVIETQEKAQQRRESKRKQRAQLIAEHINSCDGVAGVNIWERFGNCRIYINLIIPKGTKACDHIRFSFDCKEYKFHHTDGKGGTRVMDNIASSTFAFLRSQWPGEYKTWVLNA